MQPKYRLYQRSNRASGTFYAEDCVTRARVTLGTKDRAEAEKLLQAKNEAHAQPVLSRELAKVYIQAQDPQFGTRTWADVAKLIDAAYEGSTKDRFEKFIRSKPMRGLMNRRLAETCSTDFLAVFAHQNAGVSTNVQLRILHNRALDLEWILRPVLSKRAWPKIKYGFRRGTTFAEHQAVLAATPNKEYRLYFELCWQTGGSQTDIANLCAEDIDWQTRRLFYARQKLKPKSQGNACLAIGTDLEAVLRQLPSEGPLFPHLRTLQESRRSNYFWTKRVKAGLSDACGCNPPQSRQRSRRDLCGSPLLGSEGTNLQSGNRPFITPFGKLQKRKSDTCAPLQVWRIVVEVNLIL